MRPPLRVCVCFELGSSLLLVLEPYVFNNLFRGQRDRRGAFRLEPGLLPADFGFLLPRKGHVEAGRTAHVGGKGAKTGHIFCRIAEEETEKLGALQRR